MRIVKRPWGNFKQLVFNKKCSVKIHRVNAGQMLSLQKHKKRSEMWYFLTPGFVQLGKRKKKVKKGEIVKIEKGKVHRLIAGKSKVEILEISFGKFSEKDIVRLEDKYGRI